MLVPYLRYLTLPYPLTLPYICFRYQSRTGSLPVAKEKSKLADTDKLRCVDFVLGEMMASANVDRLHQKWQEDQTTVDGYLKAGLTPTQQLCNQGTAVCRARI